MLVEQQVVAEATAMRGGRGLDVVTEYEERQGECNHSHLIGRITLSDYANPLWDAIAAIALYGGEVTTELTLQLDNSTRWNSAFIALRRGLRMKEPLKLYMTTDTDLSEEDRLTEEDWEQLSALFTGLQPFWECTLRLEGHGVSGSHGVIWEALPVFDVLLKHVETNINRIAPPAQHVRRNQQRGGRGGRRNRLVPIYPQGVPPLQVCYQNAWEILIEYNDLTDNNYEVYAAASLFNPCLRKEYFSHIWTHDAAHHIEPMLAHNRAIWEGQYYGVQPVEEHILPEDLVDTFIYEFQQAHHRRRRDDDFKRYTEEDFTQYINWKEQNIFQWWNACSFPTLRQMAFDTLSIPAMSAELERVFSQSKRTWTDDRNALKPESFEAIQCLKQWSLQGVYNF